MFNFTPIQLAWLAALKSGLHLQGREQLTSCEDGKDYHCCLGLACVVHNEQSDLLKLATVQMFQNHSGVTYDGQRNYAPTRVMWSLRLRGEAGNFKELTTIKNRIYASLAELNDASFSFAEIAEYIEANPENVFLPELPLLPL